MGSYYALDKDYDSFRQNLNAKIVHLNCAFLFEDCIQLFIQYFYAEKYLDTLNNMSLANSTIMLIISMFSLELQNRVSQPIERNIAENFRFLNLNLRLIIFFRIRDTPFLPLCFSCFKCVTLLRWARRDGAVHSKLYKRMVQARVGNLIEILVKKCNQNLQKSN